MISPMRDPTRTVLVVAERPHAWALLRDRLDPSLARVAWSVPTAVSRALADGLPWALAGDVPFLPSNALEDLRGHLVAAHWVGEPPAGLPTRARLYPDWADLAAALGRSLQTRVAGLRLAPSHGVLLPGGRYLRQTASLEVLLGAHPEGLELAAAPFPALPTRRAGHVFATRRLRRILERTGAPLALVAGGGKLRLVGREDAGAS
jgi:hypothetical protein